MIASADALDAANVSDVDRAMVQAEAGRRAARLIVSAGTTSTQVQALRTARQAVPTGMSAEDLGRWVSPEYIEDARFGGGRRRGIATGTGRSGLRGAGPGSVITVITSAGTMFLDGAAHPNWERELLQSAGMGTLGGAMEGAIEHRIISAGTQHAIARGGQTWFTPRSLRVGGSTAAGAVVAPILEGVDMWTDERKNSMEEVVVRTGRAAVIGGGAGWAGAAVGTAIGGPIGFVVGFGVGAGVGWLANKLLPGGGDDWERDQARIRRQIEEIEHRVVAAEARIEALHRRHQRLNTPLDLPAASSVGVEAIFGLPTTDPLFMSSEPGIQPTVGELEAAYLMSILEQTEEQE